MVYKEIYGDLFSTDENFYLAHCISADFAMGKGIVIEFNKRFNMKKILQKKYPDYLKKWLMSKSEAGCILEGRVFNLITKTYYWNKPTNQTLAAALVEMKNIALENNIKKIAMPLIGCGLDNLSWPTVKSIIQKTFQDTDLEIVVYKK